MKNHRYIMVWTLLIGIVIGGGLLPDATAQEPEVKTQLETRPYNPKLDADIDMYICNWRDAVAIRTHGCLVEREIFTHGDPKHPARKGEVLQYVNRFSHATLYARNETAPFAPDGEQEILYITAGTGTIRTADTTADISAGIFVLVPEGVTFTMKNSGDTPLTMYVIVEPITRDDFTPLNDIVVVNENTQPILTTTGHWSMIIKQAFKLTDHLCIIEYINTITFDPMTIGHPHAHLEGCEEVWTSIEGESILFLGKQIRMQQPGTAYLCPPYGNCPHSNINNTDVPIKLLYFAVRNDWSERDGIKRVK